MQAIVPHEIEYDVGAPVPIGDLIESLRGVYQISQEIGPILEGLLPGLKVQTITVQIREISQASPLREAFAFGLVAIYQDKIGQDMPKILHDLFALSISHEYNSLVSLIFIVLLFFSGQFIFDKAKSVSEDRSIRNRYDSLVAEMATMLGKSEESIKKLLDDRYGKGKIHQLIDSSEKVFQPSKNQGNAPFRINQERISAQIVAEFPSRAQIAIEEPGTTTDPLLDVEIHLHAQDIDYNRQGWAAVVPVLSQKRIRMFLYPPLKPADIYTKKTIRGDLFVESTTNDKGEKVPFRIHLVRVHEPSKMLSVDPNQFEHS